VAKNRVDYPTAQSASRSYRPHSHARTIAITPIKSSPFFDRRSFDYWRFERDGWRSGGDAGSFDFL